MYLSRAPYHLCFETLANELRIGIIKVLQEKPLSVKGLMKRLNTEQSRVSHSLEMLRVCNYVDFEVRGRERIYFLKKGVSEGMKAAKSSAPEMLEFADSHLANYCNHECKKMEAREKTR